MRVEFCCNLKLRFKNLSSNSNTLAQGVAENTFCTFVSTAHCLYTLYVNTAHCLYTLYVNTAHRLYTLYVNSLYLLGPEPSACTPINLFPSHKPPVRLSQCCCFGHINGVPLTQVQWSVNAVFGLCLHRTHFYICSSKTTLRNSRIETLTRKQHRYCTQFAEEILSFTPRLLASRVRFVGIRTRQNVELKLAPIPRGSMHNGDIPFWFTIFVICSQLSLALCIIFLPEILFQ
jgi:hypothetical protein